MAVGLVVHSVTQTGWTSLGKFSIDVTQVEMGVPHWLVLNRVTAKGNSPPPIDPRYLPEAELYQPGWHVRPGPWLLSLGGATLLAHIFYGLGMLMKRGRGRSRKLKGAAPILEVEGN